MVQTPTKPITLEEFLKLPETEPASEYIDGQIIQKPMPQGKHSVIRGELVTVINAVVKPQKIARVFPELRCTLKILHSLKHETQMGWLIDPDEQTIFVYQPKQQPEVFDEPETSFPYLPLQANSS
jgi:Uma2 family endonuclease